ncbi:hypothetical protein ND748_00235 [Frankia sp. AiPs1]|uniref:SbcC/MukB-like Walker B domain-containing protein n=1 Tax=Frankia sp. AiPs1 TaxID=573493 RepID=UPI00204472F5|nr:SbcC/MukB-like Walker B domain-containing protein [Frankia sp. AiPs1]MCM3920124.1 hypothetical protein [Frankia sp. AiPs1]
MTNPSENRVDVTLFDVGTGATNALTVDALPTAVGRWQPVRAGVVNSWAWVDEQFLFHDGWSALVGPNGSGKSLTSGQWFPTLIDGDTSTSALSMSQRGAGTLAERHHNRTPGREKTGAWWLEFGFQTPDGDLRWMTLGLWIRWRGQKSEALERVWFVTSRRVGVDLHLQSEGDPVDIDGLCEQLPPGDAQIFTSQERLLKAASKHGAAVNEEAAYADAVRLELFPGTDRDQMAALTTVLRALRSVRVNDRMTAAEMQDTLTSALPAVPTQYVELLAKNLAQSNDLLDKVNKAKQEHELLNRLSKAYGRYADTAAAATAHALLDAHGAVERVERDTARLTDETADYQGRLHRATAAKIAADEHLTKLRSTGEALSRRLDGHPGSHLPALALAVEAAHDTARLATETAKQRREEAEQARRDEHTAVEAFDSTRRHLVSVMASVRRHSNEVSAEILAEPFQTAADVVTSDLGQPETLVEEDLHAVAEPGKTWVQHRETVIRQVGSALAHVGVREGVQAQASARHTAAADAVSAAEPGLSACKAQVAGAHEQAARALRAFTEAHSPVLGPVPMHLLALMPIDPDAVTAWADQALQSAVSRIDWAGAIARHDTARTAAGSAREHLEEALGVTATAAGRLQAATAAIKETITALPSPPRAVLQWIDTLDAVDLGLGSSFSGLPHGDAAVQEAADRAEILRQAAQALAIAVQLRDRATTEAEIAAEAAAELARVVGRHAHQRSRLDNAVAAYTENVTNWSVSLQILALEPQEIPEESDAREGDLYAFRTQIATVARDRAESPLREALEAARRDVRSLEEQLRALNEEITKAESEELPPSAPPWRADRAGREGAPLWALVDFAPDLPERERAVVEGTLLTAGILDAWLDPSSNAIAGEVLLRPGDPADGRTLADVLIAQPTDTIGAEFITGVLAQIGYNTDATANDIAVIGDQLRTAWATASAPGGWQPQFIGATARAEQRRRLLEQLHGRRLTLTQEIKAACARFDTAKDHIEILVREAVLPDFSDLLAERTALAETQTALTVATATHDAAAQRARGSHDDAQAADGLAADVCEQASAPADPDGVAAAVVACAALLQHLHPSRSRAEAVARALDDQAHWAEAKRLADEAAETAQEAADEAGSRDGQAHQARDDLPPLGDLRDALALLDEAEKQFERVSADEARARGDLEECQDATEEARRLCRAAATTKDGRRLPLNESDLDEFSGAVGRFAKSIEGWSSAAERTILIRRQAQAARGAATTASERADSATETERKTTAHAGTEQHRLDEERRVHEQSFQELFGEHEHNRTEQQKAKDLAAQEEANARASERHLAGLEVRADTLAENLDRTRQDRAGAFDRLLELFGHGLIADVEDGLSYERPDDLAAAVTAAGRLSQRVAAGSVREQLQRESTRLAGEVRPVAEVFIRMGRHISEDQFGTGGLRRIVVAESDATLDTAGRLRPLRQAIADVGRRLDGLQKDYDEKLRTEIKGSLLTQLRTQIAARIDLAERIVTAIDATLQGVRTGVERVGVRLGWKPRLDDPIAQEARRHVQAANVDGNFDDMYEFFIARLADEETAESASERTARVFDYRTWYTWHVEVTHKAFSDEAHPGEVFREITKRKNPLDTLSTGEKRLASMLPLLAAVKSFYSTPGYIGPRMAFIDELDAAVDQTNMRTLLALLRDWDLDVLATLPTMGKLLVPELRTTAIHQIIRSASGARFAMPYIWRGAGLPEAVRISIPGQAARTSDDVTDDLR